MRNYLTPMLKKIALLLGITLITVALIAQNPHKNNAQTLKQKFSVLNNNQEKERVIQKTVTKTKGNSNPIEKIFLTWNGSLWDTSSMSIFNYLSGTSLILLEEEFYYINYKFERTQRTIYTYNSNQQETSRISENWDDVNKIWINNSKSIYIYDTYKNMTMDVGFFWDNWNQIWDTAWAYKTDYTYNTAGKVLTETNRVWNSGIWTDSYKNNYTYNTSNHLIQEIEQNYVGGLWENTYKYDYTVNASGEITQVLGYEWLFNNWVPDIKVINIVWYNFAKEQPLSYIIQKHNGSTYINDQRYTATYNTNGAILSELFEEWNTIWRNKYRNIISYDSQGNLTNYLNQEWIANAWVTLFGDKLTYTYNTSNEITTVIKEYWDNGNWVKFQKELFNYTLTSLDEALAINSEFKIYPIPFSTHFNIENVNGIYGDITIFNIIGKKVFSKFIEPTVTKTIIDMTEFPSGLYLIYIESADKTTTKKIIKY